MGTTSEEARYYYATAGRMTDLGEYSRLADDLPDDLAGLTQALQGLTVHIFWAERMGLKLSEERKQEVQIRPAHRKLARLLALDNRSLDVPRPLEKRLVGNCRDFSTLLASFLRCRNLPARARCGFGTYFGPGHYEDHWVVQVWDHDQHRWRWVDPQLDAFQVDKLKIRFNPLDMPDGQFITGGQAWQLARQGKADPETFGIFQYKGMDFIRGNVVRDLCSLNKIETLPWDFWGLLLEKQPDDLKTIDHLAEISLLGDDRFDEIQAAYNGDDRLRVPQDYWL